MRKVLSIILCMGLCIMCTLPVSASEEMPKENVIEKENISALSGSNCFSHTLSKLNLINGTASFSSGSLSGSGQVVTSISLYVRVPSGNFPFILNLQAPDGTTCSVAITESGTIILDDFNGCSPSGSWKIWFEPQGTVSTATITVKVYYDYSY